MFYFAVNVKLITLYFFSNRKHKDNDFTFITQSSDHNEPSPFHNKSMQDVLKSVPKLPSIDSIQKN